MINGLVNFKHNNRIQKMVELGFEWPTDNSTTTKMVTVHRAQLQSNNATHIVEGMLMIPQIYQ